MWIKKRKNAGMKTFHDMKDLELAKELFKAWDTKLKRHLSFDDITSHLVALGLLVDYRFTETLLKKRTVQVTVTMKEFLAVFEHSRFSQKAAFVIN
jgi:hypothetical protein